MRDVNKKNLNNEPVEIKYKERQKLKVTKQIRNYIESFTLLNRAASNEYCASKVFDLFGVKLSDSTVNVIRHGLMFKHSRRIKTFLLNDEQKQNNRLRFANEHLANHTRCDNILFINESYMEIRTNYRYVWRRKGEHTPEVMF